MNISDTNKATLLSFNENLFQEITSLNNMIDKITNNNQSDLENLVKVKEEPVRDAEKQQYFDILFGSQFFKQNSFDYNDYSNKNMLNDHYTELTYKLLGKYTLHIVINNKNKYIVDNLVKYLNYSLLILLQMNYLNINDKLGTLVLTPFIENKIYPENGTINESNINSGFTIMNKGLSFVFRLEEYIKVSIHEFLHMLNFPSNKLIKNDFNLEACVEYYAQTLYLKYLSYTENLNFVDIYTKNLLYSIYKCKQLLNYDIYKKNIYQYYHLRTLFLLLPTLFNKIDKIDKTIDKLNIFINKLKKIINIKSMMNDDSLKMNLF